MKVPFLDPKSLKALYGFEGWQLKDTRLVGRGYVRAHRFPA